MRLTLRSDLKYHVHMHVCTKQRSKPSNQGKETPSSKFGFAGVNAMQTEPSC